MKKFLVSTIMFFVFAVGLPLTVEGQSSCRRFRKKTYATRNYTRRNTRYATRGYYAERRRPSFYRRHRNVINMAIGTGAGALLGGVIGGGRGAGIGALAGLGGSTLYTYKLNPKKRRYYRRY